MNRPLRLVYSFCHSLVRGNEPSFQKTIPLMYAGSSNNGENNGVVMPYWLELVIFTVFAGLSLGVLAYAVKPVGDGAVLMFGFCGACVAVRIARRVFERNAYRLSARIARRGIAGASLNRIWIDAARLK